MITWLSAVQHSKRQPRQENFPDAAAIFFKLPDKVLLTGKSMPFLFVIFVFKQRTYKRYRSKFLRVTSDNVIDIISHNQRVCIVAHRVRMKAQPERFTHFCIVYGRMRSHIQQTYRTIWRVRLRYNGYRYHTLHRAVEELQQKYAH